jgi:hypothetical protein
MILVLNWFEELSASSPPERSENADAVTPEL